jgi:TRAP-type mannitol/chloroaromatic compound transport system substrate-binding protein
MAIKYIPVNKNEIQLFKRNRAIKERNRQEITDNSLIALRKVHLSQKKENESFAETASNFTGFVKQQQHKEVINVINYFLEDIN